jgi:hypothetical protein
MRSSTILVKDRANSVMLTVLHTSQVQKFSLANTQTDQSALNIHISLGKPDPVHGYEDAGETNKDSHATEGTKVQRSAPWGQVVEMFPSPDPGCSGR